MYKSAERCYPEFVQRLSVVGSSVSGHKTSDQLHRVSRENRGPLCLCVVFLSVFYGPEC